MPRRRQSSFTRFRNTLKRRAKRARRTITRQGRKAQRQVTKRGKRLQRQATKATKRVAKRVRKATTRKALTRLAKRQQLRVKKFTRGIRRQVREYQRKQRAELRVRRREFGRVVIAGEQLAEEFEKGVRVPDPGSSRPGQPPRMRTGKGRKSITVEIRMKGQKPEGRVYVDKTVAPYMAMWEFRQDGKQRPFLRPSVMDHLSEYGQQVVKAGAQLRGSNKRRAVVK